MDVEEFRTRGKEMVDYICEFMTTINGRRVTPDVGPGYLRPLLPGEAPHEPESWDEIMRDVESKIMPGVRHSFHSLYNLRMLIKLMKNILFIKSRRSPIGNIRDFTPISQPVILSRRSSATCCPTLWDASDFHGWVYPNISIENLITHEKLFYRIKDTCWIVLLKGDFGEISRKNRFFNLQYWKEVYEKIPSSSFWIMASYGLWKGMSASCYESVDARNFLLVWVQNFTEVSPQLI